MAHVVSYSHVTTASIPKESWDEAWFVFQSWKGYLQSFPGLLSFHISGRALANGDVRFYVATFWEYIEQLEVWRESQWSAANLVVKIRNPAYDIVEETYEDFA